MSHGQKDMLRLLADYRSNLNLFAQQCLTIRDKEGTVRLFPGFNSAQKHVHRQIELQRRKDGRVRALVLKGRQQGISTYIAARYYHRATLHRGVGVYILSHEQAASDNLFKMVDRFQTNNPLAPQTGVSNVKELEFNRLDSSYVVATAGQKAGGRGRTISLFHGSEVAFWQSAADHFAASVQTVPDMPGTEIVLESTGNGASGEFYERWHDAVAGKSDYLPIFVPWYWQNEYTRAVTPDFELSDEPGDNGVSEREYAELFNLTPEQMAWRRAKVAELRSVQLFDQEYPASPEMAFASADVAQSFILPIQVLRARKRARIEGAGPLVLGVDPSGPGKDRFAIAARQGPKVLWTEHRQKPVTIEAVHWVRSVIDKHQPDRVFVDLGGIGHAVYSLLVTTDTTAPDGRKYSEIIRGVNFGGTSQAKLAHPKLPGPKNRRAEMWDRLREWLEMESGTSLPDDDSLQSDITAPRIKPLLSNDFLLESKEEMRKRGVRSPDLADAIILTFAEMERIIPTARRGGHKPTTTTAATPTASPSSIIHSAYGGENAWMG